MILLMKWKVELKSLEEDESVILTNHIHWYHFYGFWKWGVFGYSGLLRKINGNPHLNSWTLNIIPCNVTGYPTLHDPVPGGQVPPLFRGLLHKILRLKMENKFLHFKSNARSENLKVRPKITKLWNTLPLPGTKGLPRDV